MSSDDHEKRRVGIYFGPSSYTTLTKEEVAEFIKNNMGLIRSDGGPKWTEGLVGLIELGMEAWDEGFKSNSEIREELREISNKLDTYQSDVNELTTRLNQHQPSEDLVDMAKEVHQTEARVLEVLSRDGHIGARSPNYVTWETISNETGLDHYIVVYYARALAETNYGEFVQIDRLEKKVKLSNEDAFENYCNQRNLNPEKIHNINKVISENI